MLTQVLLYFLIGESRLKNANPCTLRNTAEIGGPRKFCERGFNYDNKWTIIGPLAKCHLSGIALAGQ